MTPEPRLGRWRRTPSRRRQSTGIHDAAAIEAFALDPPLATHRSRRLAGTFRPGRLHKRFADNKCRIALHPISGTGSVERGNVTGRLAWAVGSAANCVRTRARRGEAAAH